MAESDKDILDRLDILVKAAMADDHNILIDVLEQYDIYMKTRKVNSDGVYLQKFKVQLETETEEKNTSKDCCVDIMRLPDNVVEQYLKKK